MVFLYDPPYNQIIIGKMHVYRNKSVKVKIIPDRTETLIQFKDMNRIDFFWNKNEWWELDSLKITLKNKEEVKASILYGCQYLELEGEVYNSALKKYLPLKEDIDQIKFVNFIEDK